MMSPVDLSTLVSYQCSIHVLYLLCTVHKLYAFSEGSIKAVYRLRPLEGDANHVQRVSAKHGVKDDFAFLWEHAIFRHPPNKNPLTDRSEILHN
jgi:hypothetical protein